MEKMRGCLSDRLMTLETKSKPKSDELRADSAAAPNNKAPNKWALIKNKF